MIVYCFMLLQNFLVCKVLLRWEKHMEQEPRSLLPMTKEVNAPVKGKQHREGLDGTLGIRWYSW